MESVVAIVTYGSIGQLKCFKRNATKDVFLIIFQNFHNSSFSSVPGKMYKVIFIEVFSQSNDFITDLFQANFQLLQKTQKETFFLKSVFAGDRKSRLQGCRVRKKGSASQNITGAWGKMFRRKLKGQ